MIPMVARSLVLLSCLAFRAAPCQASLVGQPPFLLGSSSDELSLASTPPDFYSDLVDLATEEVVSSLPADFRWGVSTASYQYEGAVNKSNRGANIWDTFIQESCRIADGSNADEADDSYHLFDTDAAIASSMGLGYYRISIAWTRIMHDGEGKVNPEGIEHYHKVIDSLLANGLVPVLCLYHWDEPQYLYDKYGGWMSSDMPDLFTAYADVVFEAYASKVKIWATFNEPLTFINDGYGTGGKAPGIKDPFMKYTAGHNVLLSHAKAAELFNTKYKPLHGGNIGIVLNADWSEPLTDLEQDIQAAELFMEGHLGWFADPAYKGDYPTSMRQSIPPDVLPSFTSEESAMLLRNKPEWFGLNHYSSFYVAAPLLPFQKAVKQPRGDPSTKEALVQQINPWVTTVTDMEGKRIGPTAQSTWLHVAPWGFYNLLHWAHKRYDMPIWVTENGTDAPGEADIPLPRKLRDGFRVNYYRGYISAINQACADGVDIIGYLAWSLLDNFEWSEGMTSKFGLLHVDLESPHKTRRAKASALWLTRLISTYNDLQASELVEGSSVGHGLLWLVVTVLLAVAAFATAMTRRKDLKEYREIGQSQEDMAFEVAKAESGP